MADWTLDRKCEMLSGTTKSTFAQEAVENSSVKGACKEGLRYIIYSPMLIIILYVFNHSSNLYPYNTEMTVPFNVTGGSIQRQDR